MRKTVLIVATLIIRLLIISFLVHAQVHSPMDNPMEPRDAKGYLNLGAISFEREQYDDALYYLNKAIEMDPKLVEAYKIRGMTYNKKRQYDRAISDFNKVREIIPMDPWAYNNLAWLFAAAKEPGFRNGEKAVALALTACELSKWKNPSCLGTLAAAYARASDFDNAVKWQKKALESPGLARNTEAQQRLKFYKERKPWPAD
jgi:tetratricopeptide (TPR) repeat protein